MTEGVFVLRQDVAPIKIILRRALEERMRNEGREPGPVRFDVQPLEDSTTLWEVVGMVTDKQ